MCEKCDLIQDAIEKWFDVVEKSKIDNSIVPLKPEHFIELIYNSLIEQD
ncbi:hypothetical protein KHQ81_10845 [Mycoplasmatota bacterium]|nr:hypothetical protein KHQ81_10845 [Mycoplasmatota bacterium]